MDELKILNIPSEMFKLFNHSIYPHQGHPIRLMHPSPHKHTQHPMYETWAPSSTMTMDELKLLSIPLISHTRDIRQGHCTPHEHTQHAHLNVFPTSSTFHFNIILNINIISSQ
ncbi:hypothetical protein GmHk_07G019598 [Glycine max]|nr:hypothetical protein GmHk_07G019598 [Glycine max]